MTELFNPISILDRIDTRRAKLNAIDHARIDFIADGGDMDDHTVLTEMGEAVALFVEKMQGLARQLDIGRVREGNPQKSHVMLTQEIAREVIAEHYRLSACAERVLTAAAEAK